MDKKKWKKLFKQGSPLRAFLMGFLMVLLIAGMVLVYRWTFGIS